LIRATLIRALAVWAAVACVAVPVLCSAEQAAAPEKPLPEKATRELPAALLALQRQKNMPKHSAVILRIFKEEGELEVWKQDKTGHFEFLKTYPICRWSGDLGPKVHEGDRQTPEGFYNITPSLMNPNSNYYLAINTGFPNVFDKANGHDGTFLMIHGDCSSSGCFAMTDEQIAEIFGLARDALAGGRPSFQVQAFPFHMTPANLARHRTSPHMPFWKMLKVGNDHFEATHLQPKVDVCGRRYVFDAQAPPHATAAPVFDPNAPCPPYVVNAKIGQAASAKQRADDAEYMQLVKDDVPTAPIYSGLDGGMNPAFRGRFMWKIVPLAIVLPAGAGTELPDMPAVPWTDKDSSLANKIFGALPEPKAASKAHVASTDAAARKPAADPSTTTATIKHWFPN
jgi:murein L,D-transpeptidase YafK